METLLPNDKKLWWLANGWLVDDIVHTQRPGQVQAQVVIAQRQPRCGIGVMNGEFSRRAQRRWWCGRGVINMKAHKGRREDDGGGVVSGRASA
eukprot:scaffold253008_cov17-Tisochrysis_lutea.AAC.1